MVSEGCRHCYAMTLSLRYGYTKLPWTAANAKQNVMLQAHKLDEPLKKKKPAHIFVNSMSDMFHEQVPDDYIEKMFDVMRQAHWHTYLILTKRPVRAAKWNIISDHIWLGTSVEDGKSLIRIDQLRASTAPIKFISFEPLLENLGHIELHDFSWAIVGGESGADFRKMDMAWARQIRDQCVAQGVAFYFKQDSAYRSETRPYIVEKGGQHTIWHQYPLEKIGVPPAASQERLL